MDGSFGLIKKLYRKTTIDCVNHIVEVVKRSSTAGLNKAQCRSQFCVGYFL